MNKATTVEKNGRFYKRETGEILTENELLKEWLVIANEQLEDYKSRCEKAIECIKENQEEEYVTGNPMLSYWAIDNLLNILQNGSEEK